MRFLRDLLGQADKARAPLVTASGARDRFLRVTGLPEVLLRDDLPLEQTAVRAWFESRIIGQPQACAAAASLVTTFKASLNDPKRPLGVLLFCGPTGVGKTALAHALGDYLFGHGERKERIVRIDLTEYAAPGAAQRLVLGPDGGPSRLIQRLRQDPFCVVLFDEIEKADPEVFDVLLNVFDEGRLTDSFGRLTHFQSAVIILTSNLGAGRRSSVSPFLAILLVSAAEGSLWGTGNLTGTMNGRSGLGPCADIRVFTSKSAKTVPAVDLDSKRVCVSSATCTTLPPGPGSMCRWWTSEQAFMKTSPILNRRQFLRRTGCAATTLAAASNLAPAILSAESPARTIGVGCIGLGTRGGDLINAVAVAPGVKVVAVSDVYGPHRQKGIERSRNPEAKAYVDYRELLADPNVDAVVIATPDHWHCAMVLDAVKAGKDIYCEKGFSRTLAEAKLMRDALKKSHAVFQLGHQARQATCALQARELIARGVLGPISLVRTGRFKSLEPEHPNWRWYGYYDRWNRPDPAQVRKDLNWDLWLGPAPKIPWNERHFWHWRCYYAYGTGYAGDLLSHEMDFVQYLLGHGIPDTCNCSGLLALLRDDREVPDTWVATYQFEKLGRTVTFEGSMNANDNQPVTLCGRDATLRFDDIAHNVSKFELIPADHNRNADLPQGYERGKTPAQPNHMVDWLNCIRTRSAPKCSSDEAFVETATFLMSLKAQQEQRMVRWDAAREEIV